MKDLPVRPAKRDRAVLEPFLRRRDVRRSMRGARVLLDMEDEMNGSSSWFELGAANPALEARPVDDLGRVVVKSDEVTLGPQHTAGFCRPHSAPPPESPPPENEPPPS